MSGPGVAEHGTIWRERWLDHKKGSMDEILERLLIDFRNPLYPNGGVLTTEAQVKAALIVAWQAGREYGRSDTVVKQS